MDCERKVHGLLHFASLPQSGKGLTHNILAPFNRPPHTNAAEEVAYIDSRCAFITFSCIAEERQMNASKLAHKFLEIAASDMPQRWVGGQAAAGCSCI